MNYDPSGATSPKRPMTPSYESMGLPPLNSRPKSGRKWWLIAGALVSLLCLCGIACAVIFGAGVAKTITEKAGIESTIDRYMRAMTNRDVATAYALFSARARRQFSPATVEKLIQGNNYVVFDGCQSLSINNLNISASVNTNQDLPQGTVAKVDGAVSYTGGFIGQFTAVLEQEGSDWRLHGINVNVPPDKMK